MHYLFRLRPLPCGRSGAPGQCLQPLLLAGRREGGPSQAPPRPGQPRGAAAKGGDPGGHAPAPGELEGDFPRPPPPPRQPAPFLGARGCRPSGPRAARRSRGHRALRPVRARPARAPGSAAREAQAARNFAPVSGVPPRHVKPLGARAVARVRTRPRLEGRGTGEAAGFKWGPSGGLRPDSASGRGARTSLPRAEDRWGPPPGKVA